MASTATPTATSSVTPTNHLTYVVFKKDGTVLRAAGGVITPQQVPANGNGVTVAGIGCVVLGHVYTPHRADTWTVLCEEV